MSHDSMDVMIPPDMVNPVDSYDGAVLEDGSESVSDAGSVVHNDEDDDNATLAYKSNEKDSDHNIGKPPGRTFSVDPPECRQGVGPQIVREDGLDFDLSQPWQRSLLRELRQLDAGPRGYRQAELLLLGHTDSRDYAVEMGNHDDMTLTTDSSSTLPHRPQVIHRAWPHHNKQLMNQGTSNPTGQVQPVPKVQGNHYQSSQFQNNQVVEVNGTPAQVGIPVNNQSPKGLREERDLSADQLANDKGAYDKHGLWLEMQQSGDIDDNATTAIQSDPGAACHCFGYNVLDLWMPAPQRTYRSKGRRRQRPIHPAYLAKLAEGSHEDDVYDERSHGAARETRGSHRVASDVREGRIAGRADPDGAYSAHYY